MYIESLTIGKWLYEGRVQWLRKDTIEIPINVFIHYLIFCRVGRPKYNVVIPSTSNQLDTYIGKDLDDSKRGLYKLRYPIKHGVIEHWDDMELLWKHAYSLLKISPN